MEAPGTAEASDFGDRGEVRPLLMREQEGGKAIPVHALTS